MINFSIGAAKRVFRIPQSFFKVLKSYKNIEEQTKKKKKKNKKKEEEEEIKIN